MDRDRASTQLCVLKAARAICESRQLGLTLSLPWIKELDSIRARTLVAR